MATEMNLRRAKEVLRRGIGRRVHRSSLVVEVELGDVRQPNLLNRVGDLRDEVADAFGAYCAVAVDDDQSLSDVLRSCGRRIVAAQVL
jgi:hypothetical protein